MRKVDRLWMQAIELGIDDKLVRFLTKLRAVSRQTWGEFQHDSHEVLYKFQRERDEKRWRKQSRAEKTTYGRPPMNLKPTRARKF